MGTRSGLDYTAVVSVGGVVFADHNLDDLLTQVRYLELGALTAYSGKDLEAVLDG